MMSGLAKIPAGVDPNWAPVPGGKHREDPEWRKWQGLYVDPPGGSASDDFLIRMRAISCMHEIETRYEREKQ